MLEGFKPQAVANALPKLHHAIPDFDSNHVLQAQLILQWDVDFGSQVLEVWKPSDQTWTEVFGRATDAALAVRLALSALGSAGVRSAIAATGVVHGAEKQVILMAALISSLDGDRSNRLSTSEPGILDQMTQRPQQILPATPSTSNKPLLPLLNERPTKPKITANTPAPSAHPFLTPITGSNPSPSIWPSPSIPRHPFTPDSVKENVHPPVSKKHQPSAIRPARKQPTQEQSATFQMLFDEDDARQPNSFTSKSVSTSQPPQPRAFRDATNLPAPSTSVESRGDEANHDPGLKLASNRKNLPSSSRTQGSPTSPKIFPTTPLDPIVEEEDHHMEPRSPKPSESGVDQADSTVAQDAAEFPSVDGFSREMDVGYEQESYMGGDWEDGYPSERDGKDHSQSERGSDSDDDHSTPEDDDDERSPEEYSDGEVDPVALNPWTWSQETNDEKVESWGVEESIEEDPCSTAPVRAKWMYEARKQGMILSIELNELRTNNQLPTDMSDEEYSSLLQEEHSEFMKIPVACRAAAGQMWYKDSMLDWEVRVFWAPLVYQYALLKYKCEAAEEDGDVGEVKQNEANRRSLATEAVAKLFGRFPDLSPDHERRRIKETYGNKGLSKYIAVRPYH